MDPFAERLWQRAQRYLAQGQMAPARATLDSMQARAPQEACTHLLGAAIAWAEDRVRDASRNALDAASVAPPDPALLCDIAETLWYTGEIAALRECLARPALTQSGSGALLTRLSDFCQRLDENVEALTWIERALAAGVEGPEIRFHHGVQLAFNGRLKEAEAELEVSLGMAPAFGRAAIALARLGKQTPNRHHLAIFEDGLRKVVPGTQDHAALEFACYEEFEDLQRYDDAWQALLRGNALMHARNRFDAARQRDYLDNFIGACTPQVLRPAQDVHDEGPRPIFILGLTRSGTTVLDRILGNHSQVTSAGELGDFTRQLHWVADHGSTQDERFVARMADLDFGQVGHRYLAQTQWRARGRRFYIDKQPPNWMLAGLIHAALPQARILHMVREPMDVCFSNWRAFFGDDSAFSYDLGVLPAHYADYRRLMAHWHLIMPGAILDVPYAELVREPEATARKVLRFCGLEWESGCTDLTRNKAPLATLSVSQVREPIHTRAFEAWRPYEDHLSGLRRKLDDIAGGGAA